MNEPKKYLAMMGNDERPIESAYGECMLASDVAEHVKAQVAEAVAAERKRCSKKMVRPLQKALDDLLNHDVANRGTKDAFFRCHTYHAAQMKDRLPKVILDAEKALAAVRKVMEEQP